MTGQSPATPIGHHLFSLIREALGTAALGGFLTLPIVGLKTVVQGGLLSIETHVDRVALIAGAIFILRLVYGLARHLFGTGAAGEAAAGPLTRFARQQGPILAVMALVAALIMPFFASGYVIDLATTVLIYVMLGWGLNIVVGLAGLLDLGYVGFYAVGAYTVGLLSTNYGWSFWACLPIAGALAAGFGVVLGFPVLRLRGDYLAIVTMGFGEIIRIVLLNWAVVTNGPNGINNIPQPTLFGLSLTRTARPGTQSFYEVFGLDFDPTYQKMFLYFIILFLALVTNFFTLRMRRLPIGRAWEALREDEIACRAMGINATNIKLSAFAIGAMFGGFAGAFFAARQKFISPESFNFSESAIILAIVVLGGMGSQLGVVLAAITLVVLQQQIGQDFAEYRMLLFGAAMVLIMVTRPRGLLSLRRPSILLHRKTGGAA